MKRTDIERMISLADDRYIDEIFQDKITGKRRNIFVTFAAVAAALALVAGGIGYLVSNAGNADKITVDDPIVTEVGVADYSLYFQNKTGGVSDGYVSVRDYNDLTYVVTDKSELDGILPFDTEDIFSITADVLCSSRNNDVPYAADVRFSYNDFSKVNIIACKEGGLSNLDIENAVPVKLGDIDVYGFDLTENNYDTCLEAYFVSNGTEYIVSGKNVSHSKLGSIIYGIIYNGFSPKNIDISNARLDYVYRSEDVSIEEANLLEPFAGLIPQPLDGFVLYRGVTCTYRETSRSSELYSLAVTFADVPNLPNTRCNKSIQLYYSTEYKIADYCIKIYNLIPPVIEPLFHDGSDPNGGQFTVDFGNFLVEIQAEHCSTDEVWAYIEAIKSNMRGEEISLAEANNIAPYTGFVPQVEKVGDMKLGSVQYNGMDISLYYSGSSGNIRLTYTTNKDAPSNYYGIVTIEELKNGDIQIHRSDSDDDRHGYTFAVECNGMYGEFYVCIDGENCTTAELYDCILTLLMDKSSLAGDKDFNFTPFGTLAEANKLEPFAGYVPTAKEIGNMKIYTGDGSEVMSADSEEYGRVLKICYQSEVTSGNVYGEYDFKAISTMYTEKKAYNIPEAPVISDEEAPIADLDKLKTDGVRPDGRVCYRFIIDCGTCYITVAADCLPEEMQDYLMAIALQKEFGVGSLEYSNKLEPFAGYVPTKQDVLIYDKEELGESGHSRIKYLHETVDGDGALVHMHLRFYRDIKNLTLDYYMYGTDLAAGRNIGESVMKLDDVTLEILKPIFGDGKIGRIIIDCGNFFIEVHAENCSAEEVWAYVGEIKGNAVQDAADEDGKILTIDKVKELAKKGDDLTWSDFDGYTFTEGGSGLYIKSYSVEGGYNLMIGGEGRETKPMYIYLSDGNDNTIDIRYDSIDDFLN